MSDSDFPTYNVVVAAALSIRQLCRLDNTANSHIGVGYVNDLSDLVYTQRIRAQCSSLPLSS
jgi:hypothetical protein